MDNIRQPFVAVCLLIFNLNLGATTAHARAVYQDYFGTGHTSFIRLRIENDQIRWDILRNPIEGAPVTRRVFFGDTFDSWLAGDFDGDSVTDIGVWKSGSAADPQGHFQIKLSSNPDPEAVHIVAWGRAGDIPGCGDFDGDGRDDFLAIRLENEAYVWYMLLSSGGSRRTVFGSTTKSSFPMSFARDFNGDGREDLIISSTGTGFSFQHLVKDALTGELILNQTFGNVLDSGVTTILYDDYVGDGRADITLNLGRCPFVRKCRTAGTWWTKETGSENIRVVEFGAPLDPFTGTGDSARSADYDGDGKMDLAALRVSTSTFYALLSSNGQALSQHWDGDTASATVLSQFDVQSWALSPTDKAGSDSTSIPLNSINTFLVKRNDDGSYKLERLNRLSKSSGW